MHPFTKTKRAFVLLPAAVLSLFLAISGAAPQPESLRFVILGDRTGEARPGVYEQVWQEVAAENPAFVITVGDTIEGLNDATAPAEWQEVDRLLKPYQRFPLYFTAGNHDIWSEASERLFRQHTARPLHYSFDRGPAHFTVLDNSRSDELPAQELTFLEEDLKAHAAQPVKFIFSHRPSWLLNVALRNSNFPLHQLALKYGVQYVIAGHVHQLLRFDLQGVTYLSTPSAGGHLRASEDYKDGWFFGHSLVSVRGADVKVQIEELKPPHGQGRVTNLAAWGMLGLVENHRDAGGSLSPGTPAK